MPYDRFLCQTVKEAPSEQHPANTPVCGSGRCAPFDSTLPHSSVGFAHGGIVTRKRRRTTHPPPRKVVHKGEEPTLLLWAFAISSLVDSHPRMPNMRCPCREAGCCCQRHRIKRESMAVARKFGDGVHFWNVPDVQVAAAGLAEEEVPVDRFDLDIDAWFGEACEPTIRNVVDHMRYIRDADLSKPIILSAEGHVLDGQHRLAKCLLDGVSTINAQQFEVNPPPFKVEAFDEFRKRSPLIAASLERMETGKL